MRCILEVKVKETLDKSGIVTHLSRKKFLWQFIKGLVKVRKVQFCEIATELNKGAKSASNERRIQSFFEKYELNYTQVAIFLILFIPKGKVILSMDRTNWKFGNVSVNILAVVARCGNVGLPIYFEMLDNNGGNSNTEDRQDIIQKCVAILGKERIGCVVMDREFIGHEWLKSLKGEGVDFCVRIPKHHLVTLPNTDVYRIEELLAHKNECYFQGVMVDGIWTNLYIKRLANGEYLSLIGSCQAKELGGIYRKRWCIETFFQCLKKRGFDLEGSHLRSLEKLKKLFALVAIAFAICFTIGRVYIGKVQKERTNKKGYLMKSIFRRGLDWFREYINGKYENVFTKLIRIFNRWMDSQITHNQTVIKIIG